MDKVLLNLERSSVHPSTSHPRLRRGESFSEDDDSYSMEDESLLISKTEQIQHSLARVLQNRTCRWAILGHVFDQMAQFPAVALLPFCSISLIGQSRGEPTSSSQLNVYFGFYSASVGLSGFLSGRMSRFLERTTINMETDWTLIPLANQTIAYVCLAYYLVRMATPSRD